MKLQILENKEFGKIRMQMHQGEPWFVVKDVCKILGLKNPRDRIKRHCFEEDVCQKYTLTSGGKQRINYINESGLYALIFNSEKKQAKRFKHWVTSEVLPGIRKTGSYQLNRPPDLEVNNHLCHPYLHWCLENGYSVRSGQYSGRIRKHPEHFIKNHNLWYISQDYGHALLAYRKNLRRLEQAAPIAQGLLFKSERPLQNR